MLVADLTHFLDLPDDVPGPARRLAAQLGGIVQAATAGDAGTAWVSALPCHRRPGNRRCRGQMIVRRPLESPAAIRWRCSICADEGLISCWEDSPYDLRRRRLAVVCPVDEITITDEVAQALRELRELDTRGARVVFRIRATGEHLLLSASDDELHQLIGLVAAEANQEPNRRRRLRLRTAFDTLSTDETRS